MHGLFITATGTETGKTLVACGIARMLANLGEKVAVMKPVSSGGIEDAVNLKSAAQSHDSLALINPCRFKNPLAPYCASYVEKNKFSKSSILRAYRQINRNRTFVIVEGIGGVRVPLTKNYESSDLIRDLNLPAIVVSHAGLGTLNHTLLTLEHLTRKKIKTLGIILNFFDENSLTHQTNLRFLKGKSKILACIPIKSSFQTNYNLLAKSLSHSPLIALLKSPSPSRGEVRGG